MGARRFGLAAAALLAALALTPAANAATFDWSYSGGPGVSGSGTFDATYLGSDTYSLTNITGVANGLTILGLSDYDDPDQLIFSPSPPDIAVDSIGFSFSVGDGTESFNLYEDDGIYASTDPYSCGAVYCLLGPGDTLTGGSGDPVVALTSFTVTPTGGAVPEPAAWAMMLLGIGSIGIAMRLGRRNYEALSST